jgi:FMN phosphatase YigB (HAD superfamily)
MYIRKLILVCSIVILYIPYNYLTAFYLSETIENATLTSEQSLPFKGHVIFDLGNVLVNTKKSKVFWHLGPRRLALYWISTGKSPQALKRTLYRVMNSVEQQYTTLPQSYDDEGIPLPSVMHNWLSGKHSNDHILRKLTGTIMKHPEWFSSAAEQIMIQNLIQIMFTPKKFIATRTFIDDGIKLVRWCKSQGFKVYVLSNWDPESFLLMKKENPAIFNIFDGIIISGDHHHLKPDPTLYTILLNTFNIDPYTCIMIDDRIENIKTARTLGIHGIHYTPDNPSRYDFRTVEKEIQEWIAYMAQK